MSVYRKHLEEFSLEEKRLVVNQNDFEIGDVIGKGGFGQVRRAIYKKTGVECGIKEIFAERLEGNRFRRYIGEIETLSRCDNMFLVPFVGFTAQPPYLIVTEFMPNGSLDKYVHNKPGVQPLSGTQLTAIAIGIAHGMVHLHSIGIIHRDLKAANILLDSRLFPRICDFGIARFEEHGSCGMTAKIGTPNYMAPELIQSNDYDRKVDVYAFAMILYEMNENQRPFRNVKEAKDIFKLVIQNNERPILTRATPPAMQDLIKKCWERDPDNRPSFEDIFDLFASGKVAFPDTNRQHITKFLKIIEKDEERRDELAKLRSRTKTETGDYDQFLTSGSSYYDESFSLTDTGSSTQSLFFRRMHSSDTSKSSSYSVYSDKEDSDEETAHADVILGNYKNPKFISYLEYYAETIDTDQFKPLFDPIRVHFNSSTPLKILNVLYKACYTIMKRNPQFIPLFNQEHFFVSLPTGEGTADNVINCLSVLFTEKSKILGQAHCKIINGLAAVRPEKILVLHSFYVKQLLSFRNPWPIIDNLLSINDMFLYKSCGYLYLSIFHYLITNYEAYERERSQHVKSIFIKYTYSNDARTINAAYNGLSLLFNKVTDLDFPLVAYHLLNNQLWQSIITLLVKLDKVPASVPLMNSLIFRTNESPLPWITLLTMADDKKGAKFFLENTQWLDEEKKHPLEVMRIFLLIFRDKENRSAASSLPLFPHLMRDALSEDPHHMHYVVSSVVRRSNLTAELIQAFSESGFLKKYIEVTLSLNRPRVYTNAMSTIDKLARVSHYVPDFLNFIDPLVDLLQQSEFAGNAITTIVSLSFFPECCREFKERDLLPYFEELTEYTRMKKQAEAFVANARKV